MQMRVGLLQMADCGPRKEDLQAKGEASCRQAAAMGADIALFPEMWYMSDHHFVEHSWSHDYELWRGKHLWGNAFRKPHRYSLLVELRVEDPFVRVNIHGERYQSSKR